MQQCTIRSQSRLLELPSRNGQFRDEMLFSYKFHAHSYGPFVFPCHSFLPLNLGFLISSRQLSSRSRCSPGSGEKKLWGARWIRRRLWLATCCKVNWPRAGVEKAILSEYETKWSFLCFHLMCDYWAGKFVSSVRSFSSPSKGMSRLWRYAHIWI